MSTVVAVVAVTILATTLLRRVHRRRHGMPRCSAFRRRGRRFALGRLFDRLSTTPEQETVIESALDDLLRESRPVLREELRQSRQELSEAVREDDLDAGRLGDLFARHDAALERMRRAAVGALARIHEVLEPRQRVRLAELLLTGRRSCGGPYRGAASA